MNVLFNRRKLHVQERGVIAKPPVFGEMIDGVHLTFISWQGHP